MDIPQGNLVTCTLLENGIYVIAFKDTLRVAIDEYFDCLNWIFAGQGSDGPTIRILTDTTQASELPIMYVMQQTKGFLGKYPHRPRNRVATLCNDGIIPDLIANMLDVLQLDTRRNAVCSFQAKELDQAIVWLLEDHYPRNWYRSKSGFQASSPTIT